jgi:nucleotide-binding universal stress UspA family protein
MRYGFTLEIELRRDGRQLLSAAVARLRTSPTWEFLREGKPADEIIKAAQEWDAQLIETLRLQSLGYLSIEL